MEVDGEVLLFTSKRRKAVFRQVSFVLGLGVRTETVWVLLREGLVLWKIWFCFVEGVLLRFCLPFFKEDLEVVFWDFRLGSLLTFVIPTTLSLMGASDIPAMFRAWHRYSPASLYESPFKLIMDQRTPTRGDSCITETQPRIHFTEISLSVVMYNLIP